MFKPKVLEQISYGETIAGDEESLESSPGEYKSLEVNKNLEVKRKERIWQGRGGKIDEWDIPKGKRKCAKWYREISNRGQRYDPVFGNQEVIVILTRKSSGKMGNLIGCFEEIG